MTDLFPNLRDDSARLNEHTKLVIEELDRTIKDWVKSGVDARAILAGLQTFAIYFQKNGDKRLGQAYMTALYIQSEKLADELLAKTNRD